MDQRYMVLAVAFVAGLYLLRKKPATAAPTGAQEIFPEGETNGWRYFQGGVAISPDGTYYQNGQVAWYPTM